MGSGAEAEFSAFVHHRWPQPVRMGFLLPNLARGHGSHHKGLASRRAGGDRS